MDDLVITRYVSPVLASNMYVISVGSHAIVIDPFPIPNLVTAIKTEAIFLTHEHYDHISGVENWRELTGAKVICSHACAEGCCDPRRNLSRYSDAISSMTTWASDRLQPIEEFSCTADTTFKSVISYEWKGHAIRVFECPGHSPGSCGILVDNRLLFSGDSLLADMPTELRLPGGCRTVWEEIGKPRLRALDPDLVVYPGHFEKFVLRDYRFW